jgi:hypothetical protein
MNVPTPISYQGTITEPSNPATALFKSGLGSTGRGLLLSSARWRSGDAGTGALSFSLVRIQVGHPLARLLPPDNLDLTVQRRAVSLVPRLGPGLVPGSFYFWVCPGQRRIRVHTPSTGRSFTSKPCECLRPQAGRVFIRRDWGYRRRVGCISGALRAERHSPLDFRAGGAHENVVLVAGHHHGVVFHDLHQVHFCTARHTTHDTHPDTNDIERRECTHSQAVGDRLCGWCVCGATGYLKAY